MSELADIMMALALLLAGLEVALLVFKEPLLRDRQAKRIEQQIEETKAETAKAKETTQVRSTELTAAKARNEKAQAALVQAGKDFAIAQESREVLVYEVGEPGILPRLRARLHKTLPATPEPNQSLMWSYENYVDVWATNPAAAEKVAARLFTAKAGYSIDEFKPADAEAAAALAAATAAAPSPAPAPPPSSEEAAA